MTALEPTGGTLYYDGNCPICVREIDRLREATGDNVAFSDIHAQTEACPYNREQLLQTLHFETPDGQVLRGLDANLHVWRHTRFGWLLAWLNWPLLGPITRRAYDAWARWRYRRLYG